jgi:hypothetical protein
MFETNYFNMITPKSVIRYPRQGVETSLLQTVHFDFGDQPVLYPVNTESKAPEDKFCY